MSQVKVSSLTITMVLVLGCTAGPTSKTFRGPSGDVMSTVRCTKEPTPYFEEASELCEGGSYQVTDSYRNAGGLIADAFPGPVTWYTMSFICGPSDGQLPQFPLRGEEPSMPDSPTRTQTTCTSGGSTVSCTSVGRQ